MSTGLTINKALYSAGSTSVDVTSAVSKKVKDGVLNFTVSPSAFGIDDPAPGQSKTLDISYTINDGKRNEMTKRDGDLVSIDAPPVRLASGLQITKAEYGYSGNWTDVTNAVQDLMSSNGSIDITVGFKQLGLPDPNPNKQKELRVDYTINGAATTNSFTDGQRFRVSAPSKEDLSGSRNIHQNVNSVFGILVWGFFIFAGAFIQLLSGFATAQYSEYLIGPSTAFWWLFFMMGLFIPLFAFLGLPFLTFAIRLFKADNVILA